jgi:hypothetical protein
MKDKNLIICDLDGTIANIEHRLHYIKGPNKDWASFTKACVNDEPYKDVIEILWNMYDAGRKHGERPTDLQKVSDRFIYFFSGRSEVVRKETEEWLQRWVVSPSSLKNDGRPYLYMRKEGDYRPDTTIKYEMMYELKITPDDVLCILDDRQSVVDMWRKEGFRCLQVDAWKEEPKRHHLMEADLDDLNTEELKFLVTRERGYYNEVADRLLNTLIRTERELRKWEDRKKEEWVEKWEEDKKEVERLRPVLLGLTTTRKEDNNG